MRHLAFPRLAVLLSIWLLLMNACKESEKDSNPKDGGASLSFLATCERSADCEDGLCLRLAEGHNRCTKRCGAPKDCPQGANWSCGAPEEVDLQVCRCVRDGDNEICGDGRDNDCDGHTDDCVECNGVRVPANTSSNCGGCGNVCAVGSSCVEHECKCPNGAPAEQCTGANAARCSLDADCDDGIACTRDHCREGQCTSLADPSLCEPGTSCDLRVSACVRGNACERDADCGDGDACTNDERCNLALRVCEFRPLDGDGDEHVPAVCGGRDCNDNDPDIHPGRSEACDGQDNDCDGKVDQPLSATACTEDQVCKSGSCVCVSPLKMCGASCVDLASDAANCGACGKACSAPEMCVDGECGCGTGLSLCGGECRDSVMLMEQGLADCNGQCASLRQNGNCGECGKICAVCGESCVQVDAVSLSPTHSCALLTNGQVYCWGQNDAGQLGNGTSTQSSIPTRVESAPGVPLADVVEIDVARNVSCARTKSGHVYCWGKNADGSSKDSTGPSGSGSFPDRLRPVQIQRIAEGSETGASPLVGVTRLEVQGPDLNCAISGSNAYCWGSPTYRSGPSVGAVRVPLSDVRDLRVEEDSTNGCALLTGGTVHCFGEGISGRLGSGTTSASAEPVQVTITNGSPLTDVAQLRVAGPTRCALKTGGTVACWGAGGSGQIGNGFANDVSRAAAVETGGFNTSAIELKTVQQLYMERTANCAVLTSGEMFCWGSGAASRLGTGNTGANVRANRVQTTSGAAFSPVAHVAMMTTSTCATLTDATVYCWGENDQGQLGIGNNTDAPSPMRVGTGPATILSEIKTLFASGQHVCSLSNTGELRCWGENPNGQLGEATLVQRKRPTRPAWP